MELVILGLKNIKTGTLHAYQNKKPSHTLNINECIQLDRVDPFPFGYFSSFDYEKELFQAYSPAYLVVDTNVSEEEWYGMNSSNIRTHRFLNREATFLAELPNPFEYALEQLNIHGERLGTYNLTTWVIHEPARTEKEYESMCQILERSIKKHRCTPYTMDLSLDKHVLPYVEFLKKFPSDSYTFGRYGSVSITLKDIKNTPLSETALTLLFQKLNKWDSLLHSPLFSKAFYQTHIETRPAFEKGMLSDFTYRIPDTFASIGFDMDYLYERFYLTQMSEYAEYVCEGYNTLEELVADKEYKPLKKTHDPYDYYCCPDCDGYEMDEEPYDYEEDEQVDLFVNLTSQWNGYWSESMASFFEKWDSQIFRRVQKQYPENVASAVLIKKIRTT